MGSWGDGLVPRSDSSCNINLKQFPSVFRRSVPHAYMGWRLRLSQRVIVRTDEIGGGALSLGPGPAKCSSPPCNSHAHTHTPTRSSRSWDLTGVLQTQRASACDRYTPNPAPPMGSEPLNSVHKCPLHSLANAKSLQSCPTLCDPIDSSPPGSPRPWDSPGKNTRVGCHFLLQCMKVKSESEVAQLCSMMLTC